jgi:hypothetical protein
MRLALFVSICALGFLGTLGGCLILALDGFTTSSKRGHWSIFVPTSQAYVMAVIMFLLSVLALLWIMQQTHASKVGYLFGAVCYVGTATWLVKFLATTIQ